MQVKVFTIPMLGGDMQYDELNVFLRSKKILQCENHIVNVSNQTFWTFCIKYIDNNVTESGSKDKLRVDYAEVLDGETFKRFSKMRDARKSIAKEEGLAAFLIFLDEELAGLAKLEELTLTKMKTIKGIGDKKVEKYGQRLLNLLTDAPS